MAARDAATPKSGSNVVGVDDFEDPGFELYVISSHGGYEAADLALAGWKGENPGHTAYVYDSDEEREKRSAAT